MADKRTLGNHSIAYIGPVRMGPPDGDDSLDERALREKQEATDDARLATIGAQYAKSVRTTSNAQG